MLGEIIPEFGKIISQKIVWTMNDAYHVFRRDGRKILFSSDFCPSIADLQKAIDKVKFVPVFRFLDSG